jgi:protoheme ferro-lyase
MKTLKETIPGMLSKDWKERLVTEIEQCDIRLFQLEQHMQKIGKDSPEYSLLEAQMKAMNEYLKTLTTRASVFEIDYKLPSIEERMKTCCCCEFNPVSDPYDAALYTLLICYMLGGSK